MPAGALPSVPSRTTRPRFGAGGGCAVAGVAPSPASPDSSAGARPRSSGARPIGNLDGVILRHARAIVTPESGLLDPWTFAALASPRVRHLHRIGRDRLRKLAVACLFLAANGG